MSKVFTANVYITKSRAAIDKLFFGDSQLTSIHERTLLLSDSELAQSFLYSPNKNDGLLRFEFNFGGPGKTSVKCTFVETSQLLELLLIGNDPMAEVLRAKLTELDGTANNEESLRKQGKFVNSIKLFDTEFNSEQSESEAETLEGLKDQLESTSKYYFAFGVGPDLSQWSGPHIMDLHTAVLRNDENNIRKVDVTWVPHIGDHKLWSKKFTEELGFGGAVSKFNQVASRDTYVQVNAKELIDKGAKDYVKPNLNIRLRNLVKSWIQGATSNKNVIVAFPNDIKSVAKGITEVRTPSIKKGGETGVTITKVNKLDELLLKLGVYTAERPLSAGTYLAKGIEKPLDINKMDFKPKPNPKVSQGIGPDTKGEQTTESNAIAGLDLVMSVFFEIADRGAKPYSPFPILQPLYQFVAGLRDLDPDKMQEFTFFEETDIRILKLWKKYGLIEADDQPALIFGDESDIQSMLYLSEEYGEISPSLDFLFGNTPIMYTVNANHTKYSEEFAEVFARKATRASSFGEDVEEEDSGLDSLIGSPVLKDIIKGSDMVFRHNMSNPNVRELSYTFKPYMATLKGLDIYPSISKNFINSTARPILKAIVLKVLDEEFLVKLIATVEKLRKTPDSLAFEVLIQADVFVDQILENVASKLPRNGGSDIGNMSITDLVGYVTYYRSLGREKKYEGGTKVVTSAERHASTYLATFNDLKQQLVIIDVKTLPFFNRSAYLGKLVSLIGISNAPVGVGIKRGLAPYTGNYKIAGYSHVIEQGDIHSTFNMTRSGATAQSELANSSVSEGVKESLDRRIAVLEKKSRERRQGFSLTLVTPEEYLIIKLKKLRARFN